MILGVLPVPNDVFAPDSPDSFHVYGLGCSKTGIQDTHDALLNIGYNEANIVQFSVRFITNTSKKEILNLRLRVWHETNGWSNWKTVTLT